jgi:uronate dehydrogenase
MAAESNASPAGEHPLVVITGAAGRVGRITAQALAGTARLRLVDRQWPADAEEGGDPAAHSAPAGGSAHRAERLVLDLSTRADCAAAVKGADAIIHLAANPSPEQDADTALAEVSVIATRVAEAVAGSSVRRVVTASSVHAAGGYFVDGRPAIDAGWRARPCCEYGAAKVLSENVFELLARRTGIPVVALRLGLIGAAPTTQREATHWLGDDDYASLIDRALEAPPGFGVYFGLSLGAVGQWRLDDAERDLGYQPRQEPTVVQSRPTGDAAAGGLDTAPRCSMMALSRSDAP